MTQQICYLEVLNTVVSTRVRKKGQFCYYRNVFWFHRNPLALTLLCAGFPSPRRCCFFVKVQSSTFPATSVSQEDWVVLAFSQAKIIAQKTVGTGRMMLTGIVEICVYIEIPEETEVQLIKHFSKRKWALYRFLSLTALFLKNPINNPEKFISHTVLVAGISPCYLKG